MGDKIKRTITKNKNKIIVSIILWIILAIVFVAPFTYSSILAKAGGNFDLGIFFEKFSKSITSPLKALREIFRAHYIETYFKTLIGFTLGLSIFLFYGLYRSRPKHEYSDIEHGSSDWSRGGEQYRVLNNKEGIILAEDNYLPTDKRGNVNVLVVGRIRFW